MQRTGVPLSKVVTLFPAKDRPGIRLLIKDINEKKRRFSKRRFESHFQFGTALLYTSPRVARFLKRNIELVGVHHIEEAAFGFHADALHALSCVYLHGQYEKPNFSLAVATCAKACELGSKAAQTTMKYFEGEIFNSLPTSMQKSILQYKH